MPRPIAIVWNSKAGSAEQAEDTHDTLEARTDTTLITVTTWEEARTVAKRCAAEGARLVVAAGGDGTANAVVNGLLEAGTEAGFAIIPLGTGNDMCRTLAVPSDPIQAAELLNHGHVRAIDVVHIESASDHTFYVNMASGGFAGRVIEEMTSEVKALWGPLTYIRSAATALGERAPYAVRVQCDDEPEFELSLFTLLLANGRTSAGGVHVAPRANPEDGLLDLIMIKDSSLLDLAAVASRLLLGNVLDSEQVIYRQARRVTLRSDPPLPVSADGELVTDRPATFTVWPGALRALVGPEYAPDADVT